MTRYRRVPPSLWREPAFVALDQGARHLVLYVLSGPQSTAIGLGSFSVGAAAEDLDRSPEEVRRALDAACTAKGWQYDATARVLWIPTHWRDNAPDNPNVLRGLLKAVAEVPPCALLHAFRRHDADLSPALRSTFRTVLGRVTEDVPADVPPNVSVNVAADVAETSPEPTPKQDQEQGQYQERERRAARAILPDWFRRQQVQRGTLSPADVGAFESYLTSRADCPPNLASQGVAGAPWLDGRLAEWSNNRETRRRSDAAVEATNARLRDEDERRAAKMAEYETLTPEQEAALTFGVPGARRGRGAH